MKEDTSSLCTAISDFVSVNLDAVATLRGNYSVVDVVVHLVVGDCNNDVYITGGKNKKNVVS